MLLRSVQTEKYLRQIGSILDNCVEDEKTAKEYIHDVRNKETELWVLLSPSPSENVLALIKVFCEDRTVGEFECLRIDGDSILDDSLIGDFQDHEDVGNNEQVTITRDDLIEILNCLDVSADEEYSFVLMGAFSSFRHGIPDVEPVELVDGREMWVWNYGDEIIVGLEPDIHDDRPFNWSGFKREAYRRRAHHRILWREFHHRQHLQLEKLFDILIKNPHVTEKIAIDSII